MSVSNTIAPASQTAAPMADRFATDASVKWFWAPHLHWRFEKDGVRVGEHFFTRAMAGLFPKLYFLSQSGLSIEALVGNFDGLPESEVLDGVNLLVSRGVLIVELPSPVDWIEAHRAWLGPLAEPALLTDAAAYAEYKHRQLHRPPPCGNTKSIPLPDPTLRYPACVVERRSHRCFEKKPLSFEAFANMISVLAQRKREGQAQYCYPSTGGLYGLDLYCFVKAGRIEGLDEGVYYHEARSGALLPVPSPSPVSADIHFPQNRRIFAASAFTLFFVFNPEVTAPVYGPAAYYLATIEAGIMLATLNLAAELAGIGVCPIGLIDFAMAGKALNLASNHRILHVAEGGLKAKDSSQSNGKPGHGSDGRNELRSICKASSSGAALETLPPTAAESAGENAKALNVAEVRSFLAQSLPDYMIPAEFCLIDEIPLTANNKVDREALSRAPGREMDLGTHFVGTSDSIELRVRDLWQAVLRRTDVGIDDNFFDLGGDSMSLAQVHARLVDEWNIDPPMVKLFQFPTIRALAGFIQTLPEFSKDEPQPLNAEEPTPSGGAPTMTESDRQALHWARDHAGDVRAGRIIEKLRARGFSL